MLVGGKLRVLFVVGTRNGKKVVLPKTIEEGGKLFLPKDASTRVGGEGQSTHRAYKVDKVKVEPKLVIPRSDGTGVADVLLRIFFVSNPNGVNSAQGDVSPGKTFTFSVVYREINYSWNKHEGVESIFYSLGFVKPDCP